VNESSIQYRNRAITAFSIWAPLLALVVAISCIPLFFPSIDETVGSIMDICVKLINT
jgi:hypothetical protein